MKQPNNLESYIKYRAILKIISEKELTARQIAKETKIPQTTVYNILRAFLGVKAIKISSYKLHNNVKERAFSVNPDEIKKYL